MAASAAGDDKLNVLLIAVDDLRPDLGCYGNKVVDTPHFGALAKSGVRFDRAYCQFPLCNPSRTSLLTGRQPNTTGVLDNSGWFREAHPEWVSLPQHFQANGYVTARTGKIYHGGIDDTDAWMIGGEMRRDRANRPRQNPANSDRIVILEGDGESHGDYKSATRAIELLDELKDKPFFLAVGFSKPHSPPTAPQKLLDLYDPAKISLPPDFAPRPTVPPGFPTASVPPRSGDLFIGRDASSRQGVRPHRAALGHLSHALRSLRPAAAGGAGRAQPPAAGPRSARSLGPSGLHRRAERSSVRPIGPHRALSLQ
jgi:arylsulfatase A-like enzyme